MNKDCLKFQWPNTRLVINWLLLILTIFTGCKDKEIIGPGDSDAATTSATIGPDGGVLSLDNGKVILEIPENALPDTTVNISITEVITDEYPEVIDQTIYDLSPSGLQFALPVQLTISYDPANLNESTDTLLFITRLLENGDQELFTSEQNGTKVQADIQSFSRWSIRHYDAACGSQSCGRGIQNLTSTYKQDRTITLDWNYGYSAPPATEVQRAVIKGSFTAPDSAFRTLSYTQSFPGEFTDRNIGNEAAFYFYRIRWQSGNVFGPFSNIARETVLGDGNECTDFTLGNITKTSMPGVKDSVNIFLNRLNGFMGNINLDLLSSDGNLPSQEIFFNFEFKNDAQTGNIWLHYTLANWTAGQQFQFTIRGFTSDGSSACNGNFTLEAAQPPVQEPIVYTLAGNGQMGFQDGIAESARFNLPWGLAVANNIIYIADLENHSIRAIDQDTVVTTLAGTGNQGYQDGSNAQFAFPFDIIADAQGKYAYVSDYGNHTIRRLDLATGATTTYAGTGSNGFSDGNAASAQFHFPSGMEIINGALYVADLGNHAIRKITLEENPADAIVNTFAGSGVIGSADGPLLQASFNRPQDLAYDAGNDLIYVVDSQNELIRTITSNGQVNTPWGLEPPANFAFDAMTRIEVGPNGEVWVADQTHVIRKFTPCGGECYTHDIWLGAFETPGFADGNAQNARFNVVSGLLFAQIDINQQTEEVLLLSDGDNHAIRMVRFQ